MDLKSLCIVVSGIVVCVIIFILVMVGILFCKLNMDEGI